MIPDLDDPEFSEKWISNLIDENIRLKKLVHDLQQEIDRLVEYVKACDKAGLSTPEIHPLEDK